MARISDIQRYNNARKDKADFETLKFQNDEGDVMVVKPQEVRDVLHDFIESEFGSMSETTKVQIKERLDFKLKQVENSLFEHINDKILKITEKIMERTINRVIEEEVNKRVNEKLDKIRKFL